jgi:hypothetical protein
VITYTRKVTYSTSSDKHYRVLLKVVSDTGNVANCFKTVSEFNFCNFTKSGVRLLRRGRVNLSANASFLRCAEIGLSLFKRVEALLESRSFRLEILLITTVTNQLVECWHVLLNLLVSE